MLGGGRHPANDHRITLSPAHAEPYTSMLGLFDAVQSLFTVVGAILLVVIAVP